MAATTDDKSPPAQTDSHFLLSKALASASSLVLLQLCSRIITFVLNQALVRLVSPQVFGTAAIQFELLLSTILFLSREGVRSALLRESDKSSVSKSSGADAQSLTTNISILPALLGIPAAIVISVLYVKTSSSSTASQPYFTPSVAIYAVAASFELLSEPYYIRAQNEFRFDLRVKAEGTAVVLKAVVAFIILAAGATELALVAFAIGQAVYGLTLLVLYASAYHWRISYWPTKATINLQDRIISRRFDATLLQLSLAMSGQSIVKHFLTEGDRFMVSRLSPLEDQGGYAIASNYGSLVARIVFQPIEETARVYFSKTLSSQKRSREALRTASTTLFALLLTFTHLLLLIITFGPPYLALVMSVLLPPKYHATSAPTILRVYIYYIPAMAYNGVLEAFFSSVSSPADLRSQSRWMFAFSIGFVVAAVSLAQTAGLGDAGLVWANVANLLCRTLYAGMFALRFFREGGGVDLVSWRKAVPPVPVLVLFGISALVTRWSEARHQNVPLGLGAQTGHLGVGVCSLLMCLTACAVFEREAALSTLALFRRR